MKTNYDFSILRTLRRKRKLTLEGLAASSGLSYPTVASIETNKAFPSLKSIDAIAGALGMPVGRLISLAEHRRARTLRTDPIDADSLKDYGVNLRKINVANYDNLKIFRASVKAGSVVNSMRLHDDRGCYELCYCLSGSIEIRVENEIHKLSADAMILFDGALDHEYTALTEAEYIVMHMPKDVACVESLFESTVT